MPYIKIIRNDNGKIKVNTYYCSRYRRKKLPVKMTGMKILIDK